jgi:Ca2+-binding EF-hand superfamily protein
MKNLNYLLLTAFIFGITGTTVIAGEYPVNERVDAILERFDSNQDDVITQEEAGRFWKRLEKADLDKDGEVTKKEMLEAWGEEPPRPDPGPRPRI